MPIAPERVAPYDYPMHPLETGEVRLGENRFALSVVDCGLLNLDGGQLIACDPFAAMQGGGQDPWIDVPKGRFPVKVTLADVSDALDGSHVREAYASVVFRDAPRASRKQLCLLAAGETAEPLEEGDAWGFGVDAGTACFADKTSLDRDMPDPRTWYDKLFDDGSPTSWFSRMDDPAHIRAGIANIPLPNGDGSTNLVVVHSGWGDGHYSVVGDFDADGELLAVHIDFQVVAEPSDDEDD